MGDRLKIRVFYYQCSTLDRDACSFLLLSQNLHQDVFEFEIHDLDLLPSVRVLKNRSFPDPRIPREQILATCQATIEDYNKWVNEKVPIDYNLRLEMGSKSIFITQIPLAHNYYAVEKESDIAVVSVADWDKEIAPPSVLEFIMRIVQRYAVSYLYGSFLQSHFATRGCLFDFNMNLYDVKNKVLLGYICQDCEQELVRKIGVKKFEVIEQLVGLKWIGEVNMTGTIANILKKSFGYDLDLTKGLKPTWEERAKETLQSALIQQITTILAAVLAAVLLLYLGLK